MLRSMIAGVAVTLMASSGALAQSCTGNPVAVQVLGSGAPGFVKDRANTSYLLWVGNQAKILVDAGGGAYVRFGQAQAKFPDLSMILVSHLHPDHSSDLPGVLWSGRNTRNDTLPIVRTVGERSGTRLQRFSHAPVRSQERLLGGSEFGGGAGTRHEARPARGGRDEAGADHRL